MDASIRFSLMSGQILVSLAQKFILHDTLPYISDTSKKRRKSLDCWHWQPSNHYHPIFKEITQMFVNNRDYEISARKREAFLNRPSWFDTELGVYLLAVLRDCLDSEGMKIVETFLTDPTATIFTIDSTFSDQTSIAAYRGDIGKEKPLILPLDPDERRELIARTSKVIWGYAMDVCTISQYFDENFDLISIQYLFPSGDRRSWNRKSKENT